MDAGALVVAHRNVRDWIHTENVRMLTEAAANQPVYQELRARMDEYNRFSSSNIFNINSNLVYTFNLATQIQFTFEYSCRPLGPFN